VHVLNWNAPLLAVSPIEAKVTSAHSLLDNSAAEFTQNANGVVLKLPAPKADETDRVIVLTVAK
jgi:hypothetical protein